MKELQIAYHHVTGQIIVKDAYSDKNNYFFRKPEELYAHFTKNEYGLSIKNRGRVHIVVDLDKIIDESFKKEIKNKLASIDWAKKTIIDYKKISDFHI